MRACYGRTAEAGLGYPVNAVVRPFERWSTVGDALIGQVRASPHVVLHAAR